MKKIILGILIITNTVIAQTKPTATPTNLKQPKLVVGIVVDQMRQDYIYRYWNKFGNGGFKKLINEGYSIETLSIIMFQLILVQDMPPFTQVQARLHMAL